MSEVFAPFTLPLRREGDAAIVDANGKTVLVIDPDRDLEDEQATAIADHVFAALRAQPQTRENARPVGWCSIDSAPKDGTVIDVWRAEGGKDTVHWGKPHHDCGEAGSYCDSDWHSIRAPGWVCNTFDEFIGRNHNPFTHWKPLDEGPDAAASPAFTHPASDALLVAAKFLSERLADFANDVNQRDFYGHIAPAAARLRDALPNMERSMSTDEPWYGERDPHEVDQAYGEYDGTSCAQCGRQRVMTGGATGRRICEKCGVYQEDGE